MKNRDRSNKVATEVKTPLYEIEKNNNYKYLLQ